MAAAHTLGTGKRREDGEIRWQKGKRVAPKASDVPAYLAPKKPLEIVSEDAGADPYNQIGRFSGPQEQ